MKCLDPRSHGSGLRTYLKNKARIVERYSFNIYYLTQWNTTTDVTCDFLRSIRDQNTYSNKRLLYWTTLPGKIRTSPFSPCFLLPKLSVTCKPWFFLRATLPVSPIAKGDYLFIVNNDTEFTPGLAGRLAGNIPDLSRQCRHG